MLTNLKINNYAIIDNLEIDFHNAFTVITGETGAGKSIIMGALGLIAGDRFDSKILKYKDRKSIVEAEFNIEEFDLSSFFAENDLDYDSGYCVVRRELSPAGKSRVFVNDTPVSLSLLKELSGKLIDIHSQNSNVRLNSSAFQLNIVDCFSDNKNLLASYDVKYREYISLSDKLNQLKADIEAARKDEEYNKFLLNQILPLNLVADEDADLEETQKRLSNVSDIKSVLWDVSSSFNNEHFNLSSELKSSVHRLSAVSGYMSEIQEIVSRLDSASIEISDIISQIDSVNESITDDPEELNRVNERLSQIYDLERKHNVASVNDLIKIQNDLSEKVNIVDDCDLKINQLTKDLDIVVAQLKKLADNLSSERCKGAEKFEKIIVDKAKSLGLPNFRCKFTFDKTDFTPTGTDKVNLLVSFNKNQNLMPLSQTASGGEMARIMLCMKSALAVKMNLPTIIFDEIDTGVSGDIANRMGNMMREMSERMQVLSITHLPQVAALGNYQYKVYKEDLNDSTATKIKELSNEERIIEIAGMVGAGKITNAAVENAKSLLNYE